MYQTAIAAALAVALTTGCSTLKSLTTADSPEPEAPSLDAMAKENQRELSYSKFDAPTGIAAFEDHQRNQHALTRTRAKVFVIVSNEKPAPVKTPAVIPKEAVPAPRLERPQVQIPQESRIDYPVTIQFATNSSELSPYSSSDLMKLADLARNNDVVIITGHTDSVGSVKANLALGMKRADAIRKHLLAKGIDSSRITVETRGESTPVATNETDDGRAQNRRAEVRKR